MKVICDKQKRCKHKFECGGSKPHEYDENECGKCPMDKTATCIEVPEIKYHKPKPGAAL